MPRPSLKSVRTKELLDAFMRCVARFGIEGATLEKISDEAEMARPMLRHYLGNRDQMVSKLITHVLDKFDDMTRDMISDLPETDRLTALLDQLFEGKYHETDNAAVFQALVAASDRYSGIREPLMKFVQKFEKAIAKEVIREFPNTERVECNIAASGISAIYFNTDAITPLGPSRQWRKRQKQAARALLNGLK